MTIIERELIELKKRVERLEARAFGTAEPEALAPTPATDEPLDPEQLLTWLETEGVIRAPTPEEQRLAAEWDMLLEDEKQAHLDFMDGLQLDPPLSQIIVQNRQ
ncbi:MAG: hypothetical protein R3264_05900 [Anaerolineae bacterium]|nr:hypothetical protein [Anaerolineae bacterium]